MVAAWARFRLDQPGTGCCQAPRPARASRAFGHFGRRHPRARVTRRITGTLRPQPCQGDRRPRQHLKKQRKLSTVNRGDRSS
eukprot:1195736-Prorocentrum_minimum.AAC.5